MALSLAHQVVAERRPSRNRLCVAIAPLLVLVVTLTTARISHAVPARLTTEQRSEVRKLLSEFRRARKTPEKRDAIVEKLLKIGAPTPENLLKTIQKEIGPQLKKYGTSFQKRAAELGREQWSAIKPQEVQALRAKVLALKERKNLTKRMIVAEGDPAMARLRELFVFKREKVLESTPALKSTRTKLLSLGRHWQQCVSHIEAKAKAEAKANPAAKANMSDQKTTFENYLRGEEELAAQLAMPMNARTRSIFAANARLASKIDSEERRAILACNLMRHLLGLNVCRTDIRLVATGRDHSADMQNLKFFAHESPIAGKKEPWDRAKRFGTTASSENIAMGYHDGKAVNLGWFHSPGHHRNMLGRHARIGIGRTGVHYTELFGR